jgi:hypothetical protein
MFPRCASDESGSGKIMHPLTKLIFILVCVGHFWAVYAQDAQAVSVCDALKRLLEIDNEVIAVRGEYVIDPETIDVRGNDCGGTVVLQDVRWPAVIALRGMQKVDSPLKRLFQQSATCERPKCQVKATFVGKLRSYHARPSYLDRKGIRRWVGFGHLGHAPAELEVTEIREVVFEK